ncbi:DNA polymerase Y family protein [Aurantiacibacter spongiae]|uniref:DNA polymerase Y family protein n=2 Tax=Aurantiacibacter spongiae TaxID=2488860 RepID=A0A3N5CTT4_9SPHN|nr:DNA polymerase Y family protein [Aurantiacibacter spongiae]
MAIWCAQLALDRWRHAEGCAPGEGVDAAPLVLVTETAHGPRIDAANPPARAVGGAPGMMLADARTLYPKLEVRPSDQAGDLAFLERFAVWTQRWGPWSALDAPDGVLVDVSAVAHLFGGERRLLADVHDRCAARGLAVRAAIAPTAGAAWALAHYGPPGAVLAAGEDMRACLSDLPMAALRLDTHVLLVLKRLGLKRLGDIADVEEGRAGRDAIQRRFRNRRSPAANPLIRLDQIMGRVPEPLLPVVAIAAPLVQRRLLEPIRHRPLLDKVVEDLAADMVRELEARGEGARRLQLGMWRVDGEVVLRELELAVATRDGAHVCRLFADRLDDIDAGFGIEMLRLRASWSEPLSLAQSDLEAAAEEHGTSLAACIDRLTVRLGREAVQRPVLKASHIPERAQGWQPPLEPERATQEVLAFHARPLKLLDRPERISVLYASPDGYPRRFSWRGDTHDVARVEGPERIAPEWWREKGSTRLRDYYRIEDGEGRRYWIYRAGLAGDGRGGMPDWFMQGLCA